jgi:hypothetical protein
MKLQSHAQGSKIEDILSGEPSIFPFNILNYETSQPKAISTLILNCDQK